MVYEKKGKSGKWGKGGKWESGKWGRGKEKARPPGELKRGFGEAGGWIEMNGMNGGFGRREEKGEEVETEEKEK